MANSSITRSNLGDVRRVAATLSIEILDARLDGQPIPQTVKVDARCLKCAHRWQPWVMGFFAKKLTHCPVCSDGERGLAKRSLTVADVEALVAPAHLLELKPWKAEIWKKPHVFHEVSIRFRARYHCSEGHSGESTVEILQKRKRIGLEPCARCNRRGETSKDQLIAIIKKKGGNFAKEPGVNYFSSMDMVSVTCSRGHTWTPLVMVIKGGGWCHKCQMSKIAAKKIRRTLADMTPILEGRGWRLNETRPLETPIRGNERFNAICPVGHMTQTTPTYMRHGKTMMCAVCRRESQILGLDDAEERGRAAGLTLITESYSSYENNETQLQWLCAAGHRFARSLSALDPNPLCPRCFGKNLGEDLVSQVLEYLLEAQAIMNRYPSWLKTDNKRKGLQLDIYFPDIKPTGFTGLAVEVMGDHHYRVDGFLTRSEEDLALKKERDQRKVRLCRENGVLLLHVSTPRRPLRPLELARSLAGVLKDVGLEITTPEGFMIAAGSRAEERSTDQKLRWAATMIGKSSDCQIASRVGLPVSVIRDHFGLLTPKPKDRRTRKADLSQEALVTASAMRSAGATWEQIGSFLRVSPPTAKIRTLALRPGQ